MKNLFYPILVFGLSLMLNVLTLPESVLPGDSGELIAASRTLSIGHPPGDPPYLMLGRILSSAAVSVTLAVGTLEVFWLQATTAEVYALNGLFTAVLLLVALRGRECGQRSFLLLGITGGLALSHHLSRSTRCW